MALVQLLATAFQELLGVKDPSLQFSAELVDLFTHRASHGRFPHLFRAYGTHPLFEILGTARQRAKFAMTVNMDPALIDAAVETYGETDSHGEFRGSVKVGDTRDLDTLELVVEKTIQARKLVAELYCRDPRKVPLADLLIPVPLQEYEQPDHTLLNFMYGKKQDYHNASRDSRINDRFLDRGNFVDHFLQSIARDVLRTRRIIHRRVIEATAEQGQGKAVISCQDLGAGYGSIGGYFAFLETTSSSNQELDPRYTLGDESFAALQACLPEIMTPDSLEMQGLLGRRVSLPLLSIFGGTAGLERAVHHYVTRKLFDSIDFPYLFVPHINTDGSHVAQLFTNVINPNERLARNFEPEHIASLEDLQALVHRKLQRQPQALALGLNALTFMDAQTLAATLGGLAGSVKANDYLAVTAAASSATGPDFYKAMPFLSAIREDFLYLRPGDREALEPVCDVRRGDFGEEIYQMGFRAAADIGLLDPHRRRKHKVPQGTTIYVHDSVRHSQRSLDHVAEKSGVKVYGSATDPVVVFGKTAC